MFAHEATWRALDLLQVRFPGTDAPFCGRPADEFGPPLRVTG